MTGEPAPTTTDITALFRETDEEQPYHLLRCAVWLPAAYQCTFADVEPCACTTSGTSP